MKKVIDVSKWQGDLTLEFFKKAKVEGVDGVICRAGYGKEYTQVDKTFKNNVTRAHEAGLEVGAYWFSYATDLKAAEREAEVFASTIADYSFELPLYFDQENSAQVMSVSNDTRTSIANRFYDEMKIYRPDDVIGYYSNKNFIENYIDYKRLKYDSLWVAQYASKCTLKIPYDAWQYTSTATVAGVKLDCSYFYDDATDKVVTTGKYDNCNVRILANNKTTYLNAASVLFDMGVPLYTFLSPGDISTLRKKF